MAWPTVSRGWAVTGLVAAIVVILGLAHFVSARPWDSARNATCEQLFVDHQRAQVAYLSAASSTSPQAKNDRDRTYAELGVACGWEEAQTADMSASVG